MYIQLGPEDPRTKDSDLWLKELTTNAVLMAQRARDQQQQLQQQQQQQQQQAAKTAPTAAESSPGELPIDQVLQYINGPSSKKGKKKNQKKK